MNPALILLIGFAALLLILLFVVLREPRKLDKSEPGARISEELERRHVAYFPQVRQAMAREDLSFLASRSSTGLARIVGSERRRVVLAYLSCLRDDFRKLWLLARVIASLSPQPGMAQELARLRLGVTFSVRYEMVRLKLLLGFWPLPELGELGQVISGLAIRLETAMKEMGERSALAAELGSSLDGRGLNTP
ncbi:MAG TPA: hypothetical protein VMI32_16925 [Candidatus Solibacter sp.]|nr:hypothetical protein [Candidatus Solibacter sp.]